LCVCGTKVLDFAIVLYVGVQDPMFVFRRMIRLITATVAQNNIHPEAKTTVCTKERLRSCTF
jgi:hypothetical protein